MKYDCEKIGNIILSERKKLNLTQAELGKRISTVGKQISNYERGKLLPPIDVMIALCDVFNCELGYLLDEPEYSERTKIETAITKSTGLNVDSLNNIRRITGDEKSCLGLGVESKSYQNLLNRFLSASMFITFIECLHDLENAVSDSEKVFQDVENNLGEVRLNEAFELYNSPIDYGIDPDAPVLKPEQNEALKMIGSAIDKQYDLSYKIKVARYELRESFESLIESLYPRKG